MLKATLETLYMSIVAFLVSYAIGFAIAIIYVETGENGLYKNKIIHWVLEIIISIGRAIPFIILMVLVLPFTRMLIGTGIGTTATIVPLTISAIPYIAKQIAESLMKVDYWVIMASRINGASKIKTIFKIKVGSRLFDIVRNMGITITSIIDYTAMAGVLGGGGLGSYAITNGYYKFDWSVVIQSTIVITIIIFIFQILFKELGKRLNYERK